MKLLISIMLFSAVLTANAGSNIAETEGFFEDLVSQTHVGEYAKTSEFLLDNCNLNYQYQSNSGDGAQYKEIIPINRIHANAKVELNNEHALELRCEERAECITVTDASNVTNRKVKKTAIQILNFKSALALSKALNHYQLLCIAQQQD